MSAVLEARPAAAVPARAGKLINIDNGGTLTDICVIDGDKIYRTKSVTTPYDLSKCLFDGLRKVSAAIYGEEDLLQLLLSTDHIRYSTTQGTNALVERKGPLLGLVLCGRTPESVLQTAQQREVFAALAGARVETLDLSIDDAALEIAATQVINRLASAGANRIVIGASGANYDAGEARIKKILLKRFPPHLLGAIPLLYSHEVVQDDDDTRRIWTALFNAFLHPAMERFLYNAEHRLRDFKIRNPLLIFRNDGDSARISRTAAVKTYSSGPRGGAEGSKALAAHYGFSRLVGMDIGGTTTDFSLVELRNGVGHVQTGRRGKIEGVTTSLPLCNVVSAGVGGSSIIRVVNGAITVGPDSVGGAPGPACFGLGGQEATMTDAFLVLGLLDPASFFGGGMSIDIARARAAIETKIGTPLGLSVEAAAEAMEDAWVKKVADSLLAFTHAGAGTTLAAFGGGGPMVACRIAAAAGIDQVVIPGLAAVFSAFGIAFSDIAHEYEQRLDNPSQATIDAAIATLMERAKRGMFAEGFDLADCDISTYVQADESLHPLAGNSLPADLPDNANLTLVLKALKPIARAKLHGSFGNATANAEQSGIRRIAGAGEVPLYRAESQHGGVRAAGPAVLEEDFFTARIEPGWQFEINTAGDILLTRAS